MTGLVVAADADADFNDIVTYLRREAGARIAAHYSRRFNLTLERLLKFPQSGAPAADAWSGRRACSYVAKNTPKTEFAAKPVPMACCLFRQLVTVSAVTRAGLKLSRSRLRRGRYRRS
jgi:plasmid stabilization system protein ParE